MYANILLSTDGSDTARKGLKHGIALAKALNAKLTVLTVTEPLPVGSGYAPGWSPSPVDLGSGHPSGWIPSQEAVDSFNAACKERAGNVLDEARAMAEQTGISAELVHIPDAHPATAIIETAKSRGCDLIVMGSHGRRNFVRKLLLAGSDIGGPSGRKRAGVGSVLSVTSTGCWIKRRAGRNSGTRPYKPGRSKHWVKVKNRRHPAMDRGDMFR